MAQPIDLSFPHTRHFDAPQSHFDSEVAASGISWAAVAGGAVAAAALSLTLVILGAGVGLSAVMPGSSANDSISKIGVGTICWLVASQIVASAMGGYLAGRLRTKWVTVHTHEVYFRDTAHGFLAWAVGLVLTAVFLASSATSLVGGMSRSNASTASAADPNAYFVDALFRSDHPSAIGSSAPERAEVDGILVNGLRHDELSAADRSYLSGLVAARAGINQADADTRVSEIWERALKATETARRAAAHLAYWTFLALVVGAFSASVAATLGGKQRDHVIHI
jgi:hypothetical protein